MQSLLTNHLRRRHLNAGRGIAISPLTITLLAFGLIFWNIFMFTIVPFSECGVAYAWTVGWQSNVSLLQTLLLIGALFSVVWILSVPGMLRKRQRIEATAQAVFIIVLWIALMAAKTYMLPFGTPTKSAFDKAISHFRKPAIAFAYERLEFEPGAENWPYEYPPPPEVKYKDHPRDDPEIWRPMERIFRSEFSPQVSEIEGARQCYLAQQEALKQYEKDQQTLAEYWDGFYLWRAANQPD